MYGSFRFYSNALLSDNTSNAVLELIELSNSLFSIDFDYIYYIRFDPESDRLLKNKEFTFDTKGKQKFLSEEILPPTVGSSGDISEPFIGATCRAKHDSLYCKARCEITISSPPVPTTIRIDFCDRYLNHSISFSDYKRLIGKLNELGFIVNTSCYHVYSSQNEAAVLDGGQTGFLLRPSARSILRSFTKHDRSYYNDHLSGVFCANALPLKSLETGLRQRIEAVVGKENTDVLDDRLFCFALPHLDSVTGMYRVRNGKMIRQLKDCLHLSSV